MSPRKHLQVSSAESKASLQFLSHPGRQANGLAQSLSFFQLYFFMAYAVAESSRVGADIFTDLWLCCAAPMSITLIVDTEYETFS